MPRTIYPFFATRINDTYPPQIIGIGSGSTVPYVVERIQAQGADVNKDRIFLPTGKHYPQAYSLQTSSRDGMKGTDRGGFLLPLYGDSWYARIAILAKPLHYPFSSLLVLLTFGKFTRCSDVPRFLDT